MRSLLVRLGSRTWIAWEIITLVLLVRTCSQEAAPTVGEGGSTGGASDTTTAAGGALEGGAGGDTTTSSSTTSSSSATASGGAGGATGGTGGSGGSGGTGGAPCEVTTSCNGWVCGTFDDNCGGKITCGPECPGLQLCAVTCKCKAINQVGYCPQDKMAALCGKDPLPPGCTLSNKVYGLEEVYCCPVDQTG